MPELNKYKKLKDSGINSIKEVAILSYQELAGRTDIPEKRTKVIRQRARRLENVDWSYSGNAWVLKDREGRWNYLGEIITGSEEERDKCINKIRNDADVFKRTGFDKFRNAKLDFAIFLEVTPQRYSKQDLDNVQKVVFDALQRKNNPSGNYLYEDDNQICRVVAWKVEREPVEESNTDSLTISFRIHDPSKQMIMEKDQ